MKNLLLASIVAATASLCFGVAAQAATVTTTAGTVPQHRMHSPHRMDRQCSVRNVRRHRNGNVVMEKVRVCH